jgi:hypothetical protein
MVMAQSGLVHKEVTSLGSASAARARGVAASFGGGFAHCGDYLGQLVRGLPPGTNVGQHSGPLLGAYLEVHTPGIAPALFTFVDGPHPGTGAASLAAATFESYPRERRTLAGELLASPLVAVGWHVNDVQHPGGLVENSICGSRDVLIALVQDAHVPQIVAQTFVGPGDDEALAVAVGPPCDTHHAILSTCKTHLDLMAIGGVFEDSLLVGSILLQHPLGCFTECVQTASCYTGGFAVLAQRLGFPGVFGALPLTSTTGNVRINAVAIDRNQDLFIAGSFEGSASALNFNPQGSQAVGPIAYWGGTELFVAKYTLIVDHNQQFFRLELEWVYTLPWPGASAAMALAVAPDGTLYAAGYLAEWPNTSMMAAVPPIQPPVCAVPPPPRDIWVAKFNTGNLPAPFRKAPEWQHIIGGHGDEAAFGVALDAYQRPTITGLFGYDRCFDPTPTYSLNVNPLGNPPFVLVSPGGYDAFVIGFNQNGTLREAFRTGGVWNEQGNAVAYSPINDFALHIAGAFGHWHAPGPNNLYQFNYEVDFDPGLGVALAGTYGKADAFVNQLKLGTPEAATIQLSLVIEGAQDFTPPGDDWSIVRSGYLNFLADTAAIPRDGTVAVNVVMYEKTASDVVPWTLYTADSAPLFTAAFEALLPVPGQAATALDAGIDRAALSMRESGVLACWRVIHMHVESFIWDRREDYAAARDAALDPDPLTGTVNQINAIGLAPNVTRIGLETYVIGSTADTVSGRVGFVGMVADGWRQMPAGFLSELSVFFRRQSVCPGDFNRDGIVDAQDESAFEQAFLLGQDYADWNRDGLLTLQDFLDFEASFQVPCPCP